MKIANAMVKFNLFVGIGMAIYPTAHTILNIYFVEVRKLSNNIWSKGNHASTANISSAYEKWRIVFTKTNVNSFYCCNINCHQIACVNSHEKS